MTSVDEGRLHSPPPSPPPPIVKRRRTEAAAAPRRQFDLGRPDDSASPADCKGHVSSGSSDTSSSSGDSGDTSAGDHRHSVSSSDNSSSCSFASVTKRRLYLNVPLKDAEACKEIGGRWDPTAGRWFVGAGMCLESFQDWIADSAVRCSGHGLPAASINMGGQQRMLVCSQRFCCAFLETDPDYMVSDGKEDREGQRQYTFEKVIPGYKAPSGTAGLAGYCWSYLQEGACANVRLGRACGLKHATAMIQ
eukprot:TRINITY_DN78_c1_g1_i3.p1 TRINITY_DN78_c1_g1~~TRINITY_DN78_c1_g1_i3.p1  ORF type:complete len:249 (-),score=54.90 TRINITY_DN78_c1_g1_i3:492-1238(-)